MTTGYIVEYIDDDGRIDLETQEIWLVQEQADQRLAELMRSELIESGVDPEEGGIDANLDDYIDEDEYIDYEAFWTDLDDDEIVEAYQTWNGDGPQGWHINEATIKDTEE